MLVKLANIKFLLVFLWATLAYGLANILAAYETIMNSGHALSTTEIFLTGAAPAAYNGTVNLFNEGPIGYTIMAFMIFAGIMFLKELLSFQKYLKSLVHSETCEGVKN